MGSGESAHGVTLAAVFLVSRRCNLQCTYCNVDAGPLLRTSLDPRRFEAWVEALAGLGNVELALQLHGGEPLLLDPPVELLASIARNALIPRPAASLGTIGVVTNGILLDERRAERLVEAGLRVVVSVDGPPEVHDRHRVTRSGRGSHRAAMRGLEALRRFDPNPPVIAVISEPADVRVAVDFFLSEGLSRVKINPVRPEGRGAELLEGARPAHMVALADGYFDAAVALAAHNRENPRFALYEENIAELTARAMGVHVRAGHAASWTLMVDDLGRLWAHPGGYGFEHMALTRGEEPSVGLLSRALGLDADDPARSMALRRRATFRPCAGCADAVWCAGFRAPVGGPAVSPDCVWRERLAARLEAWWRESPQNAAAVVPSRRPEVPPRLQPPPRVNEDRRWLDEPVEPVEPVVNAVLADLRAGPDGRPYLANYAEHILATRRLDPSHDARTFLQLASLARAYADLIESLPLAQSLARLARIGLEPTRPPRRRSATTRARASAPKAAR